MAETKPNVFVRFGKGIARFFRDGKAEVKKVVWPKPSTVFKNAGIVPVSYTHLDVYKRQCQLLLNI